MAREFYESQEDSLLLCASDLQHSAIYDNSAEMQACMRDVADRIAALAYTPAQPVAEQANADSAQEDAARYRWLCCKFGETRFPCALENWLEHGYIADGKPSIDAAIDVARKQGEKQ